MHRNRKAIQQLEQKVVDYEQALQRQAELLLQEDKIKQALVALANLLKNGVAIGARTVNGLGRVACKDISLDTMILLRLSM